MFWVRFGRFLDISGNITIGNNLTERRFRGYWDRADEDQSSERGPLSRTRQGRIVVAVGGPTILADVDLLAGELFEFQLLALKRRMLHAKQVRGEPEPVPLTVVVLQRR